MYSIPILISILPIIQVNSSPAHDEQYIGNALYGLQGMRSEAKEVGEMLVVLADKIRSSKSARIAQAIGNALYELLNIGFDEDTMGLLVRLVLRSSTLLNDWNLSLPDLSTTSDCFLK